MEQGAGVLTLSSALASVSPKGERALPVAVSDAGACTVADLWLAFCMYYGSEFISKAMDKWARDRGVELDFSPLGPPTDNTRVESFNGRLRQACVNAHWFLSQDDAKAKMSDWKRYYNERRPRSALQWDTPVEFARRCLRQSR